MCSGMDTRALPRVGFPIRTSPDQRLFGTYPGLIAAGRVLHRLPAPRHPPYALSNLTVKNTLATMQFSRYTPEVPASGLKNPHGGLSAKLLNFLLIFQKNLCKLCAIALELHQRSGNVDHYGNQAEP